MRSTAIAGRCPLPSEPGSTKERTAERARKAIAQRSEISVKFFSLIFKRSLKSDFHAVRLSSAAPPPAADTPYLVIYCNHPSWWDAVVCVFIAHTLFPKRHFRAPIDAAMLQRYGFMAKIGLFGVEKHSRKGAADFLATCSEIIHDERNVLMITAQGRFADCRERPLALEGGVAHLAALDERITFMPLAIEYCLWQERQAEVLLRFGQPLSARELNAQPAAKRRDMLENALEQAMSALAHDAIARDETAFTTILSGRRGINPMYDGWRRLRAAMSGRRFNPEHGAGP